MGFEPRTFEGHMDWQFSDNRGPVDPTSPFVTLTNSAQSNSGSSSTIFGSSFTSAPPTEKNNPFKPTQSQQPQQSQQQQQQQPQQQPPQSQQQLRLMQPPSTSIFSPRIQKLKSATAPPFRNPAFTTPRRPFDEAQFSEASGAEDSPATYVDESSIAETIDTPEADQSTLDLDRDIDMFGALSPTRIDKNVRYRDRAFSSARKLYSSGKGEINRHPREYSSRDVMRKRRRHVMDKDVSSVVRGNGGWDSEDEGDEGDEDETADFSDQPEFGPSVRRLGAHGGVRKVSGRRPDRDRQSGAKGAEGLFASFLSTVDRYPDVPERLTKWGVFMLNTTVLGVVSWFVWGVVGGIRHDMAEGIRAEQETLRAAIARCTKQYQENKCVSAVPALKDQCEAWWNCMMQAPESHFRFRIFARHFAETINEFANTMGLKAWAFFFAVLFVIVGLNLFGRRWFTIDGPQQPFRQPDQHHHHYSGMPQPSPYPHFGNGNEDMWTPRQNIGTPGLFGSSRRILNFDNDTDVTATPTMKKGYRHILAPPQTPSTTRRSPTKQLEYDWARARSRSPTKARSPSKYY